jgi:transposase
VCIVQRYLPFHAALPPRRRRRGRHNRRVVKRKMSNFLSPRPAPLRRPSRSSATRSSPGARLAETPHKRVEGPPGGDDDGWHDDRTEDLELLSRELGVTAAELSGWREAFLTAGEASLKTRAADARDVEIGRLKEKVGDLTMANELLETKIERLETARPLAPRRSRR